MGRIVGEAEPPKYLYHVRVVADRFGTKLEVDSEDKRKAGSRSFSFYSSTAPNELSRLLKQKVREIP
jgi:hypothetical protein